MKLYFLRHGQSTYNVKDLCNGNPRKPVFLTELGKTQIEKAREKLENEKLEVIFVSQFPRTKESAKIINKEHNIKIKIDKRINDRKTGFEGKSYYDYIKAIEKDKFFIKLKGGESFQEEKKRVFSFLKDLIKKHYNTVLVVTHEEIIKIVNGYFNKLSDEQMFRIKVDNGRIMKFEF